MGIDTKHTPGPWTWWDENTPGRPRPANYDLCKLIGATGKVIFSSYGGAGYEALGRTDEDIANAHLFDAAPDMLEALEALVAKYNAMQDGNISAQLTNGDFFAARAAIAKAKGTNP